MVSYVRASEEKSSKQLFSMPWRAKWMVISWAHRPAAVPPCPAPPRLAPPRPAPPGRARGVARFWIRQIGFDIWNQTAKSSCPNAAQVCACWSVWAVGPTSALFPEIRGNIILRININQRFVIPSLPKVKNYEKLQKYICRIQNPDTPRADGAGRGTAGRSRARRGGGAGRSGGASRGRGGGDAFRA